MKVMMQNLNVVKYAFSEGQKAALLKKGFSIVGSPAAPDGEGQDPGKKPKQKPKQKPEGQEAGMENGGDGNA